MDNQLINILIDELGYSPKAAQVTSKDLLEIQDPEIKQALSLWIKTREKTHVKEDSYDAVLLTTKMHYPSALLAIEMLRNEPEKAKAFLKGFK